MKIKKITALIIILLMLPIYLITINANPKSTFSYVWENTVIKIKLNDELSKYENLPKAYLYIDGVKVDAKIEIQKEGDWLFFLKDVDTSKVGTYYVWYKAYEYEEYKPGTCNGYKCKITFIVEDKIAPDLIIKKNEISIRRRKENDKDYILSIINDNVSATDNYSKVTISFSENVDLSYPSRYKVDVFVVDEENNETKGYFYIDVYDDYKPIIYFNAPNNYLKLSRNSDINLKDYFTAIDELDGDITDKIEYPIFNLNELGKKEYDVSVTNSGGSRVTKKVVIEIIDDIKPEIVLTSDSITLNYLTDLDSINYLKYVLKIEDDMEINYDNLKISSDLENKVGIYHIYYEYSDGVNSVTAILEARLISYKGPTIEVSNVTIKLGDYIDLYDYVIVSDDSDPTVYQSLVIMDDDIKYNESGTYYATVYAINNSGVSTTKKIKLVIEDKSSNKALIIIISVGVILFIAFIVFLLLYLLKLRNRKKVK